MQHKLLTVLLFIVLIPALALAGGKIRGKVVDKDTEEPLVGANVVIVGTSMGAATNIAGEFTILNIPAGTYTMRATYVGYQTITVSNIRANNDLVTEANFRLPSEGVTVQAVEIIAERPLINKSATNAVRIVDQEFFDKLPARGINGAIIMQPGVVSLGGNIYIRGGRPDEVGFTLDGVTSTDVVFGGNALYTTAEAVEQLQVQAGGFSAEFGNANAGLVQSQLRIGSPERWRATLLVETDNYTKQSKEALGGYSYGYSDLTATAGGPLLSRKIRIFGSVQNTFYRDPTQGTRDPYELRNYVTDNVITPYHAGTRGDTLSFNVGANAIGGMDNRWAFSGTLLFDLNNIQLKASGSYSTRENRGTTYIGNILNVSRLQLNYAKNGFANLKLSYIFSPTTYLEATGSYVASSAKSVDPDFGDDLFAYGDSLRNAQLGYRLYAQGQNYSAYTFFGGAGVTVNQPGTQIANYAKNKSVSVGGRVDLTSQMKSHELKVGGEFTRYTITRYNPNAVRNWAKLARQAANPAELENLMNKTTGLGSDVIGYDIWGNEIDENVVRDGGMLYIAPRHPIFGGVYAQDRIEFPDVVINVGLRWDYLDPNSYDTERPDSLIFNSEGYLLESFYQNTPKTSQISPRIGFSFPVTDRTVFHAQYGKFIQQTRLNDSYRGPAYISGNTKTSGLWNTGSNGWGLLPTRTTQYELGFTQQVSENASFDITAFYRDIRDQIQFNMIAPSAGSESPVYASLGNADFTTSKGLEFKFTLRRTARLQAQVNYTYMDARSTATNQASSNGIWQLGLGPNALPKYVMPTDFDFNHKGTVLLDYRFGRNDGGPVLSQLGLNMLFNFNSGHAITRLTSDTRGNTTDARFRDAVEPPGSSTTPWFFQLDGRLDKTVPIGPLEVNFFVYVINLLGTDNPVGAFYRTGDTQDDGWFGTSAGQTDIAQLGPQWADMYQKTGLGRNSGNFGPPRQIRFGLRVDL